nr:PEPxxWA-CTERM sorting domain-containing protein [Sphingomonas changnyeongensis]
MKVFNALAIALAVATSADANVIMSGVAEPGARFGGLFQAPIAHSQGTTWDYTLTWSAGSLMEPRVSSEVPEVIYTRRPSGWVTSDLRPMYIGCAGFGACFSTPNSVTLRLTYPPDFQAATDCAIPVMFTTVCHISRGRPQIWLQGFVSPSLGQIAWSITANAVPEPTSWAMLICGFGLTGTMVRHRRVAMNHTAAA